MGEKKNRLARLLATQPNCIYCGGSVPAVSRDHCPPIAVFDNAHRPAGLEFPACDDCHQGTRGMDNVVAMFSRMLSEPNDRTPKEDIEKHIKGFFNNHPELAALLTFHREATIVDGREAFEIRIADPDRIAHVMEGFAARLGLALYFDEVGRPAPVDAQIATSWYPNHQLFNGEYPHELLEAIGNPRTLKMGRFSVEKQFRYWAQFAEDDEAYFGAFAAFRESFAVLAIIKTGDEREDTTDLSHSLAPGFLKGFTV